MEEGNTSSMAEVIRHFVERYKLQYGLNKVEVKDLWNEQMGTPIARQTISVELVGETLRCRFVSASLSQELSYGKERIMNNLNEALGGEVIKKIIFLN